eukprot:TRINITY_DN8861_c0_g2_i1.p1 TRINITY_DN8861_c0_g2~~TRINITY_DN8861_c0_g2_i1.p1  ORF type:complete len:228 (-),score=108.43 TRINITY_DN8861_c0_g2_i1:106-732(-)
MSGNWKLTYFDGAGRAEKIRLLFALTDTPFEDIRVDGPKFGALKAQGVNGPLTFGSVPLLEHGSFSLTQSLAQTVFVAKSVGGGALYPATVEDQARADEVLQGVEDFRGKLYRFLFGPADQKEALQKNFLEVDVPFWTERLEHALKRNHEGKGFFVGDKLSYADVAAFDLFKQVKDITGKNILEGKALLSAFYDRVAAVPAIAKFYSK